MIHLYRKQLSRSVVTALACLLFTPLAGYAFPPTNLADALKQVADPNSRRIPLLIVNSEETRPPIEIWQQVAALFRNDEAKPSLEEALPLFGCMPESCGSVQVVAPTTSIALNPEPGPAIEWASIGRESAAHRLFASLSPAQWHAAAHGDGLGLSDMASEEQRAWFRALMPQPFIVRQVQTTDEAGSTTPVVDSTTTISPDQVRIRVNRVFSYALGFKGRDSSIYLSSSGKRPQTAYKISDLHWELTAEPGIHTPETFRDRIASAVWVHTPNRLKHSDVSFSQGPIAGATVSLSGAETVGDLVERIAAATGLELYADRRIGGLSVTVLGPENATADSGDLLKALCWATTGAIRQIEDPETGSSVYLLTNDREGYMGKRLRLADWASDVEAIEGQEKAVFQKASRTDNVVADIGFAPDDPLPVNNSGMRAIEKSLALPNSWELQGKTPITDLPPSAQAIVKSEIANAPPDWIRDNGIETELPIDTQNIYGTYSVAVNIVVPGYGDFPGPDLASLSDMLPSSMPQLQQSISAGPAVVPDSLKKFVALQIAPAKSEDVAIACTWARRHGFTALFVNIPWRDQATTKELLTAAIDGGRKQKLFIFPVISLLRIPARPGDDPTPQRVSAPEVPLERNISEETLNAYVVRRNDAPGVQANANIATRYERQLNCEWEDINVASVRSELSEGLRRVSLTPGIAGIVLSDVAAPGMALRNDDSSDSRLLGLTGGFDAAARISLIRSENIDPIDLPVRNRMLPSFGGSEDTVIPLFPDDYQFTNRVMNSAVFTREPDATWTRHAPTGGSGIPDWESDPQAVWNRLRRDTNRQLVGEIRRDAGLPKALTVFVVTPPEWRAFAFPGAYTPWDASEPLLPLDRGTNALLPYTLAANATKTATRSEIGAELAQRLRAYKPSAKPGKTGYVGVVFDASAFSVEQELSLLDVLATAP